MDFFTTKLFEAKREGYIQALKDLLKDGILSSEEFKKRETEQMGKPFLVPASHTTFDKPSYGDQPNTSVSPHGFSFGSAELNPSSGNSNAPFGGSSTPISFSFGQSESPPKYSNTGGSTSTVFSFGQAKPNSSSVDNTNTPLFGGSTIPSFSFSTTPSPTPSEFDIRATSGFDDDGVNKLVAQMKSSTIQVRDFVINEGSNSELLSDSTIPSFKITLVGDGAVGKTAWINQLLSGTFEQKYIPTMGVFVSQLMLRTSQGPVRLNIWDTAGQEKFTPIRDGYFVGSDAYVIMFNVTNRLSYSNVPNWYRDVTQERLGDKKTIVVVGNKCDATDRAIKPKMIIFHRKKKLQYYEMSVKCGYNIEKPFLYLLRKLTTNDELQFVSAPNDSKPLPVENNEVNDKPLLNLTITRQQMMHFKEGIKGVTAPVTLPETDKDDE